MEYGVYILVFLAIVVFIGVFFRFSVILGRSRREVLDAGERVAALSENVPPMDRFISPGRLFQLRLWLAVGLGFMVPFIFWACGLNLVLLLLFMGALLAWCGWTLPLVYFRRKVRLRQEAFESKILDLTMGAANALKAGMALPQAIERIGAQLGGVMSEELSVTMREYRLGLELTEALERLCTRMPGEDMRLLTSAIKLTTRSGGSLAEVLAEMVVMIRGRTEFKEKLKTLTAQGRFEALVMSAAPLAAFALLYFENPELMLPLVTTVTGWLAVGAAITLEIVGFLIVRKIVTIEV